MWKKHLRGNGPETLNADEGYTLLAKGGEIEGIAKQEGVVRIDGHFNEANHTNDMLIIGEHAVIRGSITADEIICSGRIEANLTAQKSIQLLHPAVLIGDITTPAFSMGKGVFFHGMCNLGVKPKVSWNSPRLWVKCYATFFVVPVSSFNSWCSAARNRDKCR